MTDVLSLRQEFWQVLVSRLKGLYQLAVDPVFSQWLICVLGVLEIPEVLENPQIAPIYGVRLLHCSAGQWSDDVFLRRHRRQA